MNTGNNFSERILSLRKRLAITQSAFAERLGLSLSYIHQLEAGKRTPSDAVMTLIGMLEQQLDAGLIHPANPQVTSVKDGGRRPDKVIPVLGWAHAGEATAYDEIAKGWQEWIPTECRDEKAFAVRLEGDSMEREFKESDVIVVMPSVEAYSGCYVVCRFAANDGIQFRRYETSGDRISLVPLNERYAITTHERKDFSWIYPVWGRWTQLWKGCM